MSPNGPSNTTVVLVVEDQPLVRMTAADELEEAGFRVLKRFWFQCRA
jgi:CheY-like chemotaxis protein